MRMTRAIALLLLAACAIDPDDSSRPKQGVSDIDPTSYAASVQPVMERHCGSTDCHGKLPRGLQVYGQSGLRLAGATGPTTKEESRATYVSIIGLQPEQTDALARKNPRAADDAYKLLLLEKPLAIERHRPGAALRKGEPAEKCITSWLIGATDAASCAEGAKP